MKIKINKNILERIIRYIFVVFFIFIAHYLDKMYDISYIFTLSIIIGIMTAIFVLLWLIDKLK